MTSFPISLHDLPRKRHGNYLPLSENRRVHAYVDNKIFCNVCLVYKELYLFPPSVRLKHANKKCASATCLDCMSLYAYQVRKDALSKIAKDKNIALACVYNNCHENIVKRLHVAHIGQTTGKEDYDTYGGPRGFYNAIKRGERPTYDLTIKCANHNFIQEYEQGVIGLDTNVVRRHWSALEKIASDKNIEIECQKCHESDKRVMTIQHLNGKGRKDVINHGGPLNFYSAIISGKRDTVDLTIYCRNCQSEDM